MKPKIFQIENLVSGYDKIKAVLKISSLSIYQGELTFIVGKSGSGKSTFLETIGFMNNTFIGNEPEPVQFLSPHSTQHINIKDLWGKDISDQTAFRSEHLSFIFQENNLLEHFSVCDNILIPMLLKKKNKEESIKIIKYAFSEIHLSEEMLYRNVRHLSGGQRQRIAFLRALLSDRTVLLGDEPTGNLDAITSNILMKMIQDKVKSDGSSAIIVSHDLSLANTFSDRIIFLAEDSTHKSGIVKSSFRRQGGDWINELNQQITHFNDILTYL